MHMVKIMFVLTSSCFKLCNTRNYEEPCQVNIAIDFWLISYFMPSLELPVVTTGYINQSLDGWKRYPTEYPN